MICHVLPKVLDSRLLSMRLEFGMDKRKLNNQENVYTIRGRSDERRTVRDLEDHIGSMERILETFAGEQPGDAHSGRYLLREALMETPVISEPTPDALKQRLRKLYELLGEADKPFANKTVRQILAEDPALKAHLDQLGHES